MASRAAALVAGIIDQIENRPLGTGRPRMPTIEIVETALRFFVREGVQWRELWATAGRACGSTLRRRLSDWSATAVLRRVHVALHLHHRQPHQRVLKTVPSCLAAERYWDQARWAVATYAWRFDGLERTRPAGGVA